MQIINQLIPDRFILHLKYGYESDEGPFTVQCVDSYNHIIQTRSSEV